jgi:hypothetical protein
LPVGGVELARKAGAHTYAMLVTPKPARVAPHPRPLQHTAAR